MIRVVGISFENTKQIYYNNPKSLDLRRNVTVIVETERGLQFGKVMAGYDMWKDEYDFTKNEIQSILKIYVRFCQEEKEKPELTEKAREYFKKLEEGNKKQVETWEWIRKISLENYQKTYKKWYKT